MQCIPPSPREAFRFWSGDVFTLNVKLLIHAKCACGRGGWVARSNSPFSVRKKHFFIYFENILLAHQTIPDTPLSICSKLWSIPIKYNFWVRVLFLYINIYNNSNNYYYYSCCVFSFINDEATCTVLLSKFRRDSYFFFLQIFGKMSWTRVIS